MKIDALIGELEKFAPKSLAEEFDRVGLMVGGGERECASVMLALDLTDKVIDEAISAGANLIVTHHPYIWDPMKNIDFSTIQGRQIKALIENGITVYSMHTNLDKAEQGLNVTLAKALGKNVRRDEEGVGAIFEVDESLSSLAKRTAAFLDDDTVKFVGEDRRVRVAYVVTGSGGSEFDRAFSVADVFLTGELKHHQYLDAIARGKALIEFSHYYSEIIMQDILERALSSTGVKIFKAQGNCPFRRYDK